ncbi:hypothetical protein [Capnocytophaga leadbetteri]|jgi:hypothetical protein|uniref:hypothetical protein n=1 Tax=Capnocytophaga leadbetteri TaxID=327575 RepID=UPI0028CFEE70|nr:hypothetical protein [Capnocytophaga leadbetteri]
MDKENIKKFISFLRSKGRIKSQKDFAFSIGYRSESAFSQAIAKDIIPTETFEKIKNLYPEFEDFLYGEYHLEPKNWIIDDLSRYESSKHNTTSLERVGLRLDEICRVKNISYQDLAKLIKVNYGELVTFIAGKKSIPASVLEKVMEMIPEIRPIWLILGYGSVYKEVAENKDEEIKLLKQEIEELKKRTNSTENVDRKTA